jgi:uncharacterized protein
MFGFRKNIMSINYLTVPGYGSSGPDHWQTYFEKTLPNCKKIEQKSWDKPVCKDWLLAINEAIIKYPSESVVLISHSMGGIAIAHWAAKFGTKIKAAMIVAPPDLDAPWQDLGLQTFAPIPTKKLPFKSIIVASTNDQWATIERSKELAINWGSDLIFIGESGHINASSGFGEWGVGLNILKNLVS